MILCIVLSCFCDCCYFISFLVFFSKTIFVNIFELLSLSRVIENWLILILSHYLIKTDPVHCWKSYFIARIFLIVVEKYILIIHNVDWDPLLRHHLFRGLNIKLIPLRLLIRAVNNRNLLNLNKRGINWNTFRERVVWNRLVLISWLNSN